MAFDENNQQESATGINGNSVSKVASGVPN